MEVIFRDLRHVGQKVRDTKLPNTVTTHGQPILPAVKDRVTIDGLWFVVTHIEWWYEEARVIVYLKRDYDIAYL